MEPSDYAAADAALPLPGLERPKAGVTDLELAARRSLDALARANLLNESHSLPMALILDLARAVAHGTATGKASAAALAAAQLREAWQLLPAMEQAPAEDEWTQLARQLREEADAERERQRRQALP